MAAPSSSLGMPKMRSASNRVSSTTTSSGTRKIRANVSVFGRFMGVFYRLTRRQLYSRPHPRGAQARRHGGNTL